MLSLVALPSSASALSQRGHEFAKNFTIPGEAELLDPAGVAVNESSGDVYVVDRGHNRVERFGAEGAFTSAWGWGVSGGSAYAVCAAGKKCVPGAAKKPEPDAFDAPESIAVDNSLAVADPSRGDVYVANSKGKAIVDKFGPAGELLGPLFSKEEAKQINEEEYGRIDGLAVDKQGVLWIAWQSGVITHYTNAAHNERVVEPEIELSVAGVFPRPGFAVNAEGDFYLDVEPGGQEEAKHLCEAVSCTVLGLRSDGEGSYLPEPGESFTGGLPGSNETAVAVDLTSDDIFVGHPAFVSAYDPHQGLIQNFGEGHLTRTGGIGVNGASQNVYVSDAATGALELYVPEAAVKPPTLDGLSTHAITSNSAEARAQVDPGGAETTVTFEYGAGSCATGGCTALAVAAVPPGHGDSERTAAFPGLAPGSTYSVRVVAKNADGELSREDTFTTQPLPLADARAWELVSSPAAKGAGYETAPKEGGIIQAADGGGALTYLSTAPTEAGAQGNRSPYFTQNFARRTTNPSSGKPEWSSQDIAIPSPTRTPGVSTGAEQEYVAFSSDLSLSVIQPYGQAVIAEPPLTAPAKSEETQEKTLYLRRNEPSCFPVPSNCYEALVTAANDHGEVGGKPSPFGGQPGSLDTGLVVDAASPDAQHIVFTSGFGSPEAPLTTGPSAKGENVYEWNRSEPESLKPINVLPVLTPGEPERPAESVSVGEGLIARNAVSQDGARVFFETPGHHLYVRDVTRSETLQIDAPSGEVNPGGALYQGASLDGKRLFFLESQAFVAGSHAEALKPDLIEWEQTSAEGEPIAGKLTDLSVPVEAESATVEGLVPAISNDGSTVYFVANGVLASNANAEGETAAHGACEAAAPTTTCNLYVDKLEGGAWHTTFIAKLSGVDAPDFGIQGNNLQKVVSGSSPDGQYYAFMTKRPLRSNYDNRVTSAAGQGARAEEVYLYKAADGALVCASCEPDGKRPVGVPDVEESGEGLGLLVDRNETWTSRSETDPIWLAGSLPNWSGAFTFGGLALQPPHYLSDSGRLFFNSPEPLVPADENAKNDVYQYESSGTGSCAGGTGCVSLLSAGNSAGESAFLEASSSGDDVFFLTGAPLVPADVNEAYDVYDARVCTASSPCVDPAANTTAPCESRPGCDNTPSTSAPAVTSAPTSSTGPSGNLTAPKSSVLPNRTVQLVVKPLTRAQKLSKALKSCKKYKKKSRRKSCEKQARKKYGAKKKKK